jgi:hypothetical protein
MIRSKRRRMSDCRLRTESVCPSHGASARAFSRLRDLCKSPVNSRRRDRLLGDLRPRCILPSISWLRRFCRISLVNGEAGGAGARCAPLTRLIRRKNGPPRDRRRALTAKSAPTARPARHGPLLRAAFLSRQSGERRPLLQRSRLRERVGARDRRDADRGFPPRACALLLSDPLTRLPNGLLLPQAGEGDARHA